MSEEQKETEPQPQEEEKKEEQEEEKKEEQEEEKDPKKMTMPEKIQAAIDRGIDKADTNGDGYINEEEFLFMLTAINDDISDKFAKNLFFGIDEGREKRVKFDAVKNILELLKLYWGDIEENKYPLELVKVFFRAMDKDYSNTVNIQEMQDFLRSMDENISTHTVAVKLRKMDKDNSGQISFYEFAKSFGHEVPKSAAASNKAKSSCCLLI